MTIVFSYVGHACPRGGDGAFVWACMNAPSASICQENFFTLADICHGKSHPYAPSRPVCLPLWWPRPQPLRLRSPLPLFLPPPQKCMKWGEWAHLQPSRSGPILQLSLAKGICNRQPLRSASALQPPASPILTPCSATTFLPMRLCPTKNPLLSSLQFGLSQYSIRPALSPSESQCKSVRPDESTLGLRGESTISTLNWTEVRSPLRSPSLPPPRGPGQCFVSEAQVVQSEEGSLVGAASELVQGNGWDLDAQQRKNSTPQQPLNARVVTPLQPPDRGSVVAPNRRKWACLWGWCGGVAQSA